MNSSSDEKLSSEEKKTTKKKEQKNVEKPASKKPAHKKQKKQKEDNSDGEDDDEGLPEEKEKKKRRSKKTKNTGGENPLELFKDFEDDLDPDGAGEEGAPGKSATRAAAKKLLAIAKGKSKAKPKAGGKRAKKQESELHDVDACAGLSAAEVMESLDAMAQHKVDQNRKALDKLHEQEETGSPKDPKDDAKIEETGSPKDGTKIEETGSPKDKNGEPSETRQEIETDEVLETPGPHGTEMEARKCFHMFSLLTYY